MKNIKNKKIGKKVLFATLLFVGILLSGCSKKDKRTALGGVLFGVPGAIVGRVIK